LPKSESEEKKTLQKKEAKTAMSMRPDKIGKMISDLFAPRMLKELRVICHPRLSLDIRCDFS